ncbi:MAG: hypothetical protein K6F50_07505 [Kiritimatiellae bacterium]|nr:hypothetical protein [Kiritimatiellia bacterium]
MTAAKGAALASVVFVLSAAVCGGSYYYERFQTASKGVLAIAENQRTVEQLLVEGVKGNEGLMEIAEVGKCSDLKIDFDSKKHVRDGGKSKERYKATAKLELFPRRDGKVSRKPIVATYDMVVSVCGDMIELEEAQACDSDWNKLMSAVGLDTED